MKNRAKKVVASGGVLAFALSIVTPVLAFATEDGDVEAGGITAILPDMLEFIPMLIAFIVLWIILAKFGWPMFNGMLEKRENTIREALAQSEANRVESEQVLADYQKQLADAKTEASEIISNARSAAMGLREDIINDAQKQAADILAKGKNAVEAERLTVMAQLQNSVADTSIDVVARLVSQDLTDDEHRKIIERYIAEAGSFDGN